MAKAAKGKAAPEKRAVNSEQKVKTDLSFDELIDMSVGKHREQKENKNKN